MPTQRMQGLSKILTRLEDAYLEAAQKVFELPEAEQRLCSRITPATGGDRVEDVPK